MSLFPPTSPCIGTPALSVRPRQPAMLRTGLLSFVLGAATASWAQDSAAPPSETAPAAAPIPESNDPLASVRRRSFALREWLVQRGRDSQSAAARVIDSARSAWNTALVESAGTPGVPRPASVSVAVRVPSPDPSRVVVWSPVSSDAPLCDPETTPPEAAPQCLVLPARVVVLVHGLDEPGQIWDELAPALFGAGYTVVRADYPNDQPIARSADALGRALVELRALGVERVDLIGHSMGGLVSRDVLTSAKWYRCASPKTPALPPVGRLIMVGTPNQGSPLAVFEPIAEAREQLVRRFAECPIEGPDAPPAGGLFSASHDGHGEAARDLTPGSEYLKELNARPLPEGVAITNIMARCAPTAAAEYVRNLPSSDLVAVLGVDRAAQLSAWAGRFIDRVGDGAVPIECSRLEGVTDVVEVEADHRAIVNRWKLYRMIDLMRGKPETAAPAIPIILDRLGKEPE